MPEHGGIANRHWLVVWHRIHFQGEPGKDLRKEIQKPFRQLQDAARRVAKGSVTMRASASGSKAGCLGTSNTMPRPEPNATSTFLTEPPTEVPRHPRSDAGIAFGNRR